MEVTDKSVATESILTSSKIKNRNDTIQQLNGLNIITTTSEETIDGIQTINSTTSSISIDDNFENSFEMLNSSPPLLSSNKSEKLTTSPPLSPKNESLLSNIQPIKTSNTNNSNNKKFFGNLLGRFNLSKDTNSTATATTTTTTTNTIKNNNVISTTTTTTTTATKEEVIDGGSSYISGDGGISPPIKPVSVVSSNNGVFTNIFYKMKYSIISPETEEALNQINALFDKLFEKNPYSKVNVFLGLLLLDSYYSNSHLKSESYIQDKTFIETSQYYMKFASAAFGWKFINGYMYKGAVKGVVSGVTQGDALNNKILAEYTGIQMEDIITTKWTSTNFDPGHFIAYDHKNQSIVLSIRGTFHARDILSDLVAKETKFYDGHAHAGILRCAEKKFTELAPTILHYYNTRLEGTGKKYRIVVVGHSLGAGVAALFSIIFKSTYPDIPIHCYAYAPPCIISTELALSIETRELIDSFAFNDDIIPRLCYSSLKHLLELVKDIVKENDSVTKLGFQILAAGNTFGDQFTDKISNLLKVNREVSLNYKNNPLSAESMLPPGKVYRMYKKSPQDLHYVMEESNPTFFNEIIISNTLLTDHMPDKYEFGFESCLNNIKYQNNLSTINNNNIVWEPPKNIEKLNNLLTEFTLDENDNLVQNK